MPTVVDLLFRQTPVPTTSPVEILFGQTETLPDQNARLSGALPGLGGRFQLVATERNVTLTGALPGLSGAISLSRQNTASMTGALPGLSGSVIADFDINVERPVVGTTLSRHQVAVPTESGVEHKTQDPQSTFSSTTANHSIAQPLSVYNVDANERMDGLKVNAGAAHSEAIRVLSSTSTSHQDTLRDRRPAVSTSHTEAIRVSTSVKTSSQDRYRDRRPTISTSHTEAIRLRRTLNEHNKIAMAMAMRKGWMSRSQDAMRPPAGEQTTPVVPPTGICYTPSPHLVFAASPGNGNLIFYCENHDTPPTNETVIVPIRSIYIVINDVTLRRVVGDIYLPALSLSLSIDVDSWTWSFTARLPGSALGDVRSTDGNPVEVEASINGNLYRLLVENVSRSRSFGDNTLTISGRGKNAILASPYAPVLTFANSIERSAQQLMADVLQFNGVPLGWDIDWQLTNWLVPAGVFNVSGSYIDGLNAIVGAAGAYLQPHPTTQQMSALLRYPVMPWDWATDVTPDYELPTAVTLQEGIEWRVKPEYNRVYVSGQQQGKNVRVTRTGTAGDLAAPMVTDALITEAAAGRQRGMAVLGDTGRQAIVTLRLPVLEETGVITPGKFVRYVDGSDIKIGIVRSTGVDSSFPELWQSITVETHED